MRRSNAWIVITIFIWATTWTVAAADEVVAVEPVRPLHCMEAPCGSFDAVIFVHGIYGGNDSFTNAGTGFDWPKEFPREINGRPIDVFRLIYQTKLISWASGSNPKFEHVALGVLDAMKPLRNREYRSIGFIAHSLGGNIVSTYIHMVKTKLGHAHRSQNAYVITLGTPVLGAQIADLGSRMKRLLGMNDDLLRSLKRENLYSTMLNEFRVLEEDKERRFLCRSVHLHAAVEQEYLGGLLTIVGPQSAADSISRLTKSPIIGFRLNHSEIAKPSGPGHDVYRWAHQRVQDEFLRIATWDAAHHEFPPSNQLCETFPFMHE
jgi:hypothetical protein